MYALSTPILVSRFEMFVRTEKHIGFRFEPANLVGSGRARGSPHLGHSTLSSSVQVISRMKFILMGGGGEL